MIDYQIKICSFEDILPLKGRSAKHCGFQYGNRAVYLGAFNDGEIIGCCGYIVKKGKIEFVNAVVKPEFRGIGVYSKLYSERKKLVDGIPHSLEYAYCTRMSIGKYVSEGFAIKKIYKETFKVERNI